MVAPALKALERALKTAPMPEFPEFPEGDYVTKIRSISLGDSKKGHFQATWVLQVTDGTLAGKTIRHFDKLYATKSQTFEEAVSWFKLNLARFLPEVPTDLDALSDALKSLEGKEAKLNVKINGEYRNTRLTNPFVASLEPAGKPSATRAPARKAAAAKPATASKPATQARAW